jgi:thymidylate synthase
MLGEKHYLDLMGEILEKGYPHKNRTGVKTKRLIGKTLRFDLSNNKIPVFTTKKIHWKSVVMELLWFMSGQTNVNWLKENGVRIWNEWANEDGSLGPVYGEQFRFQESRERDGGVITSIDPLKKFIMEIKINPEGRRHIISLWNAPLIDEMNLPPCHGVVIQASVLGNELYLEMYQRSCDMFLGVPFNVASYSLFAHMIANECNLKAREFIWHGHDCHVYENHEEQVALQRSRGMYFPPELELIITPGFLLDFLREVPNQKWEDLEDRFKLHDYYHHKAIKAEVAI